MVVDQEINTHCRSSLWILLLLLFLGILSSSLISRNVADSGLETPWNTEQSVPSGLYPDYTKIWPCLTSLPATYGGNEHSWGTLVMSTLCWVLPGRWEISSVAPFWRGQWVFCFLFWERERERAGKGQRENKRGRIPSSVLEVRVGLKPWDYDLSRSRARRLTDWATQVPPGEILLNINIKRWD